jgi:tRNA1(Val) A37 N6-methylase TrmN6
MKPKRHDIVYDLCTGSGIIPVLLSKNKNIPKAIYAMDISYEAISLLERTISDNNLDFIVPIRADLREFKTVGEQNADMISVNPPYFRQGSGKERQSFSQAHARHELSCNLTDIARAAKRLLKYGGYLKMCHIPERLTDVICTLRENNLEPKEIIFINGYNNPVPWLFLVSAKKGGKPGIKISFKPMTEGI